jgi:tetratricopeptide (TPR) repeat protein
MALDIPKFRKLVALDDSDALSRFGLGQALFQHDAGPAALNEAAEHLLFANAKDPDHLATYHVFGQVLIKLDRKDEARAVLEKGLTKSADVGEGMGRDLGPAMAKLLESL